jgi:ATP adenylyltransferase
VPDEHHSQPTERLWTPWRMSYVGGETKEEGCIFCNRLEHDRDIESLILHRADHSFVIMNLFPYNTGHIMQVPNRHASDPSDLPPEVLAEMATTLPAILRALRRAFACHGFNVGLNIGAIAGAGVEAHLHQHIVPRWQGDANFMPIIASTMTIPELIPVTYAKIRAELTRELIGATTARFAMLDPGGSRVLLHQDMIPSVDLDKDTPIMQAITASLPGGIASAGLAGWAAPDDSGSPASDDIMVTFVGETTGPIDPGWSMAPIDALESGSETLDIVQRALVQQAPAHEARGIPRTL